MCGPWPATPGSGRPPATAMHEALEVVAQRSPEITDVLDRLRRDGEPFVCLDGTLVRTDRVAARTQASNHLWYSGRHRAFGGNVQVLTDHTGFPVWTAPVEPGSTHDITAARTHALPALYPGRLRWGCPRWRTRATPKRASVSKSLPRTRTPTPTPDGATS